MMVVMKRRKKKMKLQIINHSIVMKKSRKMNSTMRVTSLMDINMVLEDSMSHLVRTSMGTGSTINLSGGLSTMMQINTPGSTLTSRRWLIMQTSTSTPSSTIQIG
jgi:hypothetical protein